MTLRALCLLTTLLLSACGQVGDLSGVGPGNMDCTTKRTGYQPLRRLSSAQLYNTLRDLFGGQLGNEVADIAGVPKTEIDSGFSTAAEANIVNTAASDAFQRGAEAVASHLLDRADETIPALMPCGLSTSYSNADIDGCIDRFIEEFGLRAYRRPLLDDEKQTLRGAYDEIRAMQSATEAWVTVAQVMIQSPQFLYLVEVGGDPVDASDGLVALTDYEVASRLSYFLNDTMPDETLFAAAAAGELQTPEQVATHARRLLEKPDAIEMLAAFHREWLGMYDLETLTKDSSVFPEFSASVRTAMADEMRLLTDHVMHETDGSIATLLNTASYPIQTALAPLYGAPANSPVSQGEGYRAGVLTSVSFLSTHADAESTSPVGRGVFVLRSILCNDIGPPVVTGEQIDAILGGASGGATARDRFEPLNQDPSCAGCHNSINPLGFALENYDALGKWRDTENGATIDPSGAIENAGDADGSFSDVAGFIGLIANSATVQSCYSEKLYRYAIGRPPTENDACDLAQLEQTATQSGGSIREALVSMTQTNSFMYRQAEQP